MIEAISETETCARQLKLAPVRQDPQTFQTLLQRFQVACDYVMQAAIEGAYVLLAPH